jgi:hypothetical protein
MKPRIIYLNRTRPVLTDGERRNAIGGLGDAHPVLLTLRDEFDEAQIRAAVDTAERERTPEQRAYDSGYLAAVLDLRARIEELTRAKAG